MDATRIVLRVAGAAGLCAQLLLGCADESSEPPAGEAVAEPATGPNDAAHGGVGVLFVSETGWGPSERAQEDRDAFVEQLAKVNAWPASFATLATSASDAARVLDGAGIHFGFLSASVFDTLRSKRPMVVLAEVDLVGQSGFHVVSSHDDLSACLGKRLATNHTEARDFVDRAAAGAFTFDSFEIVAARRPADPLRALVRGEAECALVDDAQLAKAERRDDEGRMKVLWSSNPGGPGVLVSFAEAPAGEIATLQYQLAKVCGGRGGRVCRKAGISALRRPRGTGDTDPGSSPRADAPTD